MRHFSTKKAERSYCISWKYDLVRNVLLFVWFRFCLNNRPGIDSQRYLICTISAGVFFGLKELTAGSDDRGWNDWTTLRLGCFLTHCFSLFHCSLRCFFSLLAEMYSKLWVVCLWALEWVNKRWHLTPSFKYLRMHLYLEQDLKNFNWQR